jgi:maltose-binding protein MalE
MSNVGLTPDQKKYSGNRLKHSYYPLLFVPVLLICLLMGCQLQEKAAASESTLSPSDILPESTAAGTEPAAVVLATGTPTQAASNKLIVWLPPEFDPASDTPQGSLIKARLESFQADHSEWTIEVRLKAREGKGGLLDSLTNATYAAPGALPELIALPYAQMVHAVQKGLLLPVDSLVGQNTEDSWLPYTNQFSQVKQVQYGLPFAFDALVLVYHPNQITYPPTTWQELVSQTSPVVFPAADFNASVVNTLYQSAGGNLTPSIDAPLLQEEPLQKTFSLISTGAQSGAFPVWISNYTTFDESWEYYKSQNSGYAIAWASQYLSNPDSGTTISPLPAIGDQQVSRADAWVWCIPARNIGGQEISLEMADYFSDPDFVDQFDLASGYLPVYTSGVQEITDTDLNATIINLYSTAQILPSDSTINSINSLLTDSTIQIIKKELFFQNAVDQALKKKANTPQ